ncbi:hypothetical protein BY458DRAFT_504581 [Sporodiniella umbellata]|nr:hypothetical protein BY458DRAFT_504581 [Sporodiniella umbellata]
MESTMHEFSCCCKQPNCSQLIEFNESFLKMKNDAFLAAELGQTLLKDQDIDDRTIRELNQLRWEKKESDKVIEILKEELKSMRTYCNELKGVLKVNEKVQTLLNAKAKVEQELMTQTNDLKQELRLLDKANTTLNARYKRLHEKHETLKLTHDVLVREHEQKLLTRNESREEVVIPNQWDALSLYTVTQQAWDKLNATDVRILNKRLDRRLDMTDLSELSNTMLSRLVEDDLSRFSISFEQDDRNQPLAQLVCLMLKEMCTVKITLNDLQADFVRRIKASSRPSQPILLYQKPNWIQNLFTFCSLA